MTLAEIITRLQDVYGNTLSSGDAYYGRVVNDAYFKICAMSDWWWLEKDQVLVANAPATTVVASATIAVSAMTLSAALPSVYGARCWLGAPERVYRIETIATGTSVVLDSPWVETSTTAVSVNIWGDVFIMPTDFECVLSVQYRGNSRYKPLVPVALSDIESFGYNVFDWATDVADRYAVYSNPDNTVTSKTQVMRIFPPPDETTEYMMRYRMCPTTLSASTDVPFLPERYHPILVDFAKLELYKNEGEDSDRIQMAETEVAKGMQMLMRANSQKGNIQRKFGRRGIEPVTSVTRVSFLNTESGI